jgi:BirA family biotin operon repressor/biotin-[acetyl-CoA-carboxylase] ligase
LSYRILNFFKEKATIGHQVYSFLSLTSTNDEARLMARAGAAHGTVVIAKIQTRGRGSGDNIWYSESGGLYMSIILRPNLTREESLPFSLVIALATARAIEVGFKVKIMTKWVNDLMIGRQKTGGILLETEGEAEPPDFFIAGIGVNINQTTFPSEELITSLQLVAGKKFSRWEIAKSICDELVKNYQLFVQNQFLPFREKYKRRCSILGQDVLLIAGEERISGKAIDIDESGRLLLLTQENQIRKFQWGHLIPLNLCP